MWGTGVTPLLSSRVVGKGFHAHPDFELLIGQGVFKNVAVQVADRGPTAPLNGVSGYVCIVQYTGSCSQAEMNQDHLPASTSKQAMSTQTYRTILHDRQKCNAAKEIRGVAGKTSGYSGCSLAHDVQNLSCRQRLAEILSVQSRVSMPCSSWVHFTSSVAGLATVATLAILLRSGPLCAPGARAVLHGPLLRCH